MADTERHFDWLRYPHAEAWLSGCLAELSGTVPALRALSGALREQAGCRLVDWLDHVIVGDGEPAQDHLRSLGFESQDVAAPPGDLVYHHPGAAFPRVVVRRSPGVAPGAPAGAYVHVEDIASYLKANRAHAEIQGTPMSPFRRATIWREGTKEFGVVERRGHAGLVPLEMPAEYPARYLRVSDLWTTRPREFEEPAVGMRQTLVLAERLVEAVGVDSAAWIALAAERAFWQLRNRAGQVQKARQDGIGLGWANHDHCAFRSSRDVFTLLIQIFRTLGFRPRERFYAGSEAGWGAQVMDQPTCGLAVFCDVDLSPDEVETDFSALPLEPRRELGTIGLWCALHGESMLSAGTHHLAGRFDFEAVATGLAEWEIAMMRPFSSFPYLRQAFTRGERWPVRAERLERLAASGQITELQRAQFSEHGALGSHLESIQRGSGFKGFNQQMVNDIIQRTDPRLETGA